MARILKCVTFCCAVQSTTRRSGLSLETFMLEVSHTRLSRFQVLDVLSHTESSLSSGAQHYSSSLHIGAVAIDYITDRIIGNEDPWLGHVRSGHGSKGKFIDEEIYAWRIAQETCWKCPRHYLNERAVMKSTEIGAWLGSVRTWRTHVVSINRFVHFLFIVEVVNDDSGLQVFPGLLSGQPFLEVSSLQALSSFTTRALWLKTTS